ncbi:TetR/AcrR family transcriptional regulator [Psychrobacillus glaciei]|uniref:TetR/AcrR family transcriptional regulator n=1 Tax=Psychrobacillus glaciei TaxID=2283160 RepID=A0A5J6SPN8_9BACI|nr:TetR/AcrR family transcriptional regulator [Psychrobacillus glaciei]QFF98107.1 TetR/AcrR family transcriptional regulator [Psychrobacillus glaciei]
MPRGRKVDSDGEVTRQLLLEKAIEQFAEYGFHSTKISDIVNKAKVTQPTFYLYFESKEAIFLRITGSFQMQLIDIITACFLEENLEEHSLKLQINSNLKSIFTFFEKNPLLTKIGFVETDSARELKNSMVKQITENLKSGQRLGYYSDLYPMNLVAESLVGSIERLTLNEILTNKSRPIELAKVLVDIYFTGIQKK